MEIEKLDTIIQLIRYAKYMQRTESLREIFELLGGFEEEQDLDFYNLNPEEMESLLAKIVSKIEQDCSEEYLKYFYGHFFDLTKYSNNEKLKLELIEQIGTAHNTTMIICSLNDDNKKIELLSQVTNEDDKVKIIASINDDKLKIKQLFRIDDDQNILKILLSLKNDDTKIKLLSKIENDEYKSRIILSLKDINNKLEQLEKIENDNMKALLIIQMLKDDDKKIEQLSKIENENAITSIIESLESDKKKIELLDKLDKDDNKARIIISLKDEEEKIKRIDEMQDEETKAWIISSLEDDNEKIKQINKIQNEEIRASIIVLFEDDENKEKVLNTITDENLKSEIIISFEDDERKKKYLNEFKDEYYKAEVIISMEDENKEIELDNIKEENNKTMILCFFEDDEKKMELLNNLVDKNNKTKIILSIKDNKHLIKKLCGEITNKKYNLFNLPKNMTIGAEIECEGINNSTLGSSPHIGNWKIKRDLSLHKGLESISPIMNDEEEYVNEIYIVNNLLQNLGCNVSERCGGHVHIGADYLNPAENGLKELMEIFGNTEKIFYLISNKPGELPRDSSQEYSGPISGKIEHSELSNSKNDEFIEDAKKVQVNRYSSLNLFNINNSKNTIEFRLSNGTLDPNVWIENIRLYGRTVQLAQKISQIQQKIKYKFNVTKEEREMLKMKELLKNDISMDEKEEILLNLLFNEDEKKVYQKRYDVNKKIEKKEKTMDKWQFGKVDFQRMYIEVGVSKETEHSLKNLIISQHVEKDR